MPFTYGFLINGISENEQTFSLAYIPTSSEAINFFRDVMNADRNVTATIAAQAVQFNNFIDGNKYLSGRRGKFTERNAARTLWAAQLDFHFAKNEDADFFSLTIDVFNLTNLLNKNWGKVYFTPGNYKGTHSIGLLSGIVPGKQNNGNYPVYTFASPYSVDFLNSEVHGQIDIRYTF